MINKQDFEFIQLDTSDGHKDCWFKLNGDTKNHLTEEVMSQGMIAASACVYSLDEDIVGIKRVFPFNYDVVLSDNPTLKNILKELSEEYNET